MDTKTKTEQEIEQEMLDLNKQFSEFLHTKGIAAKFKLAFDDMKQSTQKQHETDVAQWNAVKAQSAEENKEFVEFLHTKGMKAKYNLVLENVKQGAKEAPAKTAAQIAKTRVQTQEAVARANAIGNPKATVTSKVAAPTLEDEFNAFLKSKGLDGKYTVTVTEK